MVRVFGLGVMLMTFVWAACPGGEPAGEATEASARSANGASGVRGFPRGIGGFTLGKTRIKHPSASWTEFKATYEDGPKAFTLVINRAGPDQEKRWAKQRGQAQHRVNGHVALIHVKPLKRTLMFWPEAGVRVDLKSTVLGEADLLRLAPLIENKKITAILATD